MYSGERFKGGLWPRSRSSLNKSTRYAQCSRQNNSAVRAARREGCQRVQQFAEERTGATQTGREDGVGPRCGSAQNSRKAVSVEARIVSLGL